MAPLNPRDVLRFTGRSIASGWCGRKLLGQIVCLCLSGTVPAVPAFGHGALDDQIEATSERIRRNPLQADLYLHRGRLFFDNEDVKAAQKDLRHALKVDSSLTAARYFLSEALLKDGDSRGAEREAQAFIAANQSAGSDGGLLRGYRLMGRVLMAQRRDREAAEAFRQAILHNPRPEPEQYVECAEAYFGTVPDGSDMALGILDEGIAKLGPLASLEETAIDMDLRAARADDALRRLDRRIAVGQGVEFLRYRKGEILAGLDRPDAAKREFELALTAISERPTARRATPALKKLENNIRLRLTSAQAVGKQP